MICKPPWTFKDRRTAACSLGSQRPRVLPPVHLHRPSQGSTSVLSAWKLRLSGTRDRAALTSAHSLRGSPVALPRPKEVSFSTGTFFFKEGEAGMGPSIKGSLWGQWKAKQCVLCSQLGALARGRLRTGLRTVLSGGPPTEAARRFSQDLSLPLLTQRQTKLESEQPPPGPISHSHPWASGRLHRPYPTSCLLTGPSHAGSRTGSLIHSHRQDDKPAARTEVHVDLTLFSLLPHMPKWRNSPSLSLGSPA